MVKFEGDISYKAMCYIAKRELINTIFVSSGIAFLSIIASFVMMIVGVDIFYTITFFILGLAIILMLLLLWLLPTFKKPYNSVTKIFPIVIEIENDDIIKKCKDDRFNYATSMDKVSKVLDMGEWYCIFTGLVGAPYFFCQKNLIVKGTIEEFEEIFAGKIVKKISN